MSYLEFEGVGKSFPGVRALQDISFGLRRGSVHALLGENGAGKSTLMKILGGEYQPDTGRIVIDGQPRVFHNSRDAIAAGVAIVHQELQYVPELSVAENLLLGMLPNRYGFLNRQALYARVEAQLRALGVELAPSALLRDLSIGQRQLVEVCKAVMRDATVIALDEPTSSLSVQETTVLYGIVRQLQAQGKVIIYITHRMDEVDALCDSATVFRDGRKVAEFPDLKGVTRDQLITSMVGRKIEDVFSWRARSLGATRMSVNGLHGRHLHRPTSFEVRSGEILGFFGLVGAGRSELMKLLYGADRADGGEVRLDGQVLRPLSIANAIRHGLVYCPEDRKERAIVAGLSVSENINISCRRHSKRAGFFINGAAERATADQYIQRLGIKTPGREQAIRYLSGGNQQKAILSRWLAEKDLRVLVIDEPTRGIDVGAKNEIYKVLYDLAERGVAVIMVSSELPEVLGVCDRVVVMSRGEIAGELTRAQATEANVLALALSKLKAAPTGVATA